jgi:hypothetical protein
MTNDTKILLMWVIILLNIFLFSLRFHEDITCSWWLVAAPVLAMLGYKFLPAIIVFIIMQGIVVIENYFWNRKNGEGLK